MRLDIATALRQAMHARQEEQEAKREWNETPSVRAWMRHMFATARKDRANEALTRAWCLHVGLDPDHVTEESLLEVTLRMMEAPS
jgi:thiaminase